jgi:predicted phosphodiesterase
MSPPSLFLRNEMPLVEEEVGTVGIVGDQHEPFSVDGYLDHCVDTFEHNRADRIVMIGDCIDHHAISFHDHDPDGMSPGDEYYLALEAMKDWYRAFPEAIWILGNHDRLPMRKVFAAGLPASMLRENLYQTPEGWTATESAEIDGVLYVHGGGMNARGMYGHKNLAAHRGMSCVIGHYHRCGGVHSVASRDGAQRFGLAVGCGVDHRSYSQAFCKDDGPCTLGCGIVVDGEVAHFAPFLR